MNILVIDDEPKIAGFIKKGLEEQGHNVTVVYDGRSGGDIAIEQDFNLIILDVMLPHYNGFEVCKHIRQFNREVPILILTALGSVNDIVEGLESGADDYLIKPFHFKVLLARINALVRRKTEVIPSKTYIVGDLVLDCYKKLAFREGKEIVLTSTEFSLLELLMANKGRVLSRVSIAESVWGIDFNRGTNLIDVYINYLRGKIDKGFSKKLIHTKIGMGYILND